MLIEKSSLAKECLQDTTVLVTGAGGGIGYEMARALVWLGAHVIIAEIDKEKGIHAQNAINDELSTDKAWFYHIDISNESEIDKLYLAISQRFGEVDVIFNNATIAPLGAIDTVDIKDWDRSYSVNLRAPVLLVQKFLPGMIKRNAGVIAFVSSSGAAPYMGAYEVFKTAQVELANTLVGEIENTNIITFSIGPGLVKTDTAQKGIATVAGLMNISPDAFYKMNEKQMLDAETAGTGFAISVALAGQYNGQEISSMQALMDGGVFLAHSKEISDFNLDEGQKDRLKLDMANVVKTYIEQYDGWLKRNIFERQWILRDFKKTVGISVDEMKSELLQILKTAEQGDYSILYTNGKPILLNLKKYYERQYKLLQGYEKDPQKLKENSVVVTAWIQELERVLGSI